MVVVQGTVLRYIEDCPRNSVILIVRSWFLSQCLYRPFSHTELGGLLYTVIAHFGICDSLNLISEEFGWNNQHLCIRSDQVSNKCEMFHPCCHTVSIVS